MVGYQLPRGYPPKSGSGNPNAGAGTAGYLGQIYVDTLNVVIYINKDGTNTGWLVV